MQKRFLGSTSLEVSVIGLGTVKFGRNEGVKYPQPFAIPADDELHALLAVAEELGINLIDTAPAYGNSEERLGKLLQDKRKRWIISTKVGEEFIAGKSVFDFSRSTVEKSIERSLQRLKTDYLDIVLVHSSGDDERIITESNIFVTLEKLKQDGKILAFGMSTKTIAGGKVALDLADAAMVAYNPEYTDEVELIAYAKQKQKGILIKKALGSGYLPASQALPFVLQQPGVSSVIIGTINPQHLRENVEAALSL